MPKIAMGKDGSGTITWNAENWLSGLNPQYSSITSTFPLAPKGYTRASNFDPFRALGYAHPGMNMTPLTNASQVTAICRNCCVASESTTQYGYIISSNNLLHRLDVNAKTLTSSGTWPHTFASGSGSTALGSDVITYKANNGAGTRETFVFYSYNDNAGGTDYDIGRFRTSTSAFTDNFMSTTPTGAVNLTGVLNPHPMIVGDDDVMYWGDGNLLKGYDGATGASGTALGTLLTLPAGYVITSYAKLSPYLVIFAYFNENPSSSSVDINMGQSAKAFFWDYLSNDPTFIYDLGDSAVTAGFNWNNTIGCFTSGTQVISEHNATGYTRINRMRLWNGSYFENTVEFIDSLPNHGGVQVAQNVVYWNAGPTYAYGEPYKGIGNIFWQPQGAGNSSTGLFKILGGANGYQIISNNDNSGSRLQEFRAGSYVNSSVNLEEAVLPYVHGQRYSIKSVRVNFGTAIGTSTAQHSILLLDESANQIVVTQYSTVDYTNLTKEFYYDNNGNLFPSFQRLGLQLNINTPSSLTETAPTIESIIVSFEPENIENT